MSTDRPKAGGTRASRSVASVLSFGAVVALAVFVLVDALARGHVLFALRWTPAMLFLVWLFWLLLWRPTVAVDADGVTVVNVARTARIPWSRIERVQAGPQLRLLLRDGRRIDCWGGPLPSRRRRVGDTDLPDLVLRMEDLREAAAPSPQEADVRWDRTPLVVGAALAVAAVLALGLIPT